MKKKLSVITALALSALSLTPMSSGAIFNHTNSEDVVKEWTEGRTEIDPKYNCLFNWEDSTYKSDDEVAVYINEERTCATVLFEIDMSKSCMIPAEGVTLEQINEVLAQNFEAVEVGTPADTWYEHPKVTSYTEEINGKTYYLLNYVRRRDKEISDLLKEKGLITGYITKTGFYSKKDIYFDQILYYGSASKKEIADYVVESGMAVPKFFDTTKEGEPYPVETAEECRYMKLETPDKTSLEKQLDIALDIYKKFGCTTRGVSPVITVEPRGGETIDLYNAVEGDANNDGEVDIADATLVLQSVGNADKYSLSAQGAYNADVDGNEGITALDALEIQKIDAKLR